MKQIFLSSSLVCCLLLTCLFFSCTPVDPSEDQETLRKTIIGKWNFDGSSLRVSQETMAYIQFFSNNTYVVSEASGKVTSDSYSFSNVNDIVVENFGVIKDFKVKDEQASFKLIQQNKEVSINAKKAQEISETDKTKLLCRRWKMLPIENGKDSLSQYIDSSFVTFFVDGHYETECYGKGRNKAMKLNHFWAWHPSLSDRFGYWIIQRPREDDKYYTIIRELTANELKTTESRFDGLFSYTFEPTDR